FTLMNNNYEDQDWRPRADVSAQRVARVYAEALLNAAEKEGQADAVFEGLESLVFEVFKASPELETFLSGSSVGRYHKAELIRSVSEGRASPLVSTSLMALTRRERLDLLRPILVSLRELRDQRARRLRIQVFSAVPLADDQRGRLEHGLRNYFNLEPVL